MEIQDKPKIEKPIIEKRCVECRSLTVSDDENVMILSGLATPFEVPTVLYEIDGVEYKEVIDRHALDNSDFSLCCLKYNHENSVPVLARTRNGSLQTSIENEGLRYSAKLANTSVAKDVYTLVKEGILTQCSFAFTVKRSEYDKVTHTRRILEIDKVFDISIVDIPAYEDTNVEARSFFELESKKNRLESDKLKRKRLNIQLRI